MERIAEVTRWFSEMTVVERFEESARIGEEKIMATMEPRAREGWILTRDFWRVIMRSISSRLEKLESAIPPTPIESGPMMTVTQRIEEAARRYRELGEESLSPQEKQAAAGYDHLIARAYKELTAMVYREGQREKELEAEAEAALPAPYVPKHLPPPEKERVSHAQPILITMRPSERSAPFFGHRGRGV
jgi:hypothetical protein